MLRSIKLFNVYVTDKYNYLVWDVVRDICYWNFNVKW